MMQPCPALRMMGSAALQPLKAATTFSSMILLKSSGLYSASGSRAEMPTLLTRISSAPKASYTCCTACCTDAKSVSSGARPMTGHDGSSAFSAATAFSAVSGRLPNNATLAPLCRKVFTMASPMPLVPPVTMAVFPFNIMQYLLFVIGI